MSFYAVKKGHATGVFEQWSKCEKAISGFSGADFKKFNTKEEAIAYLNDRDIWKEIIDEDFRQGLIVAFTDGSFDKSLNRYSFGVLILTPDGNESELCGSGSNPKYIIAHNIIGEVLGVINAMDWAVSNGYEKIKIYHDYEGLSKWANGEWKAESDIAKMYCKIFAKYADILEVIFKKVKGHSNNYYNDKVDSLAKSALYDRKRLAIKGDNWFCIPHFPAEDFNAFIDLVKEVDSNIQAQSTTYSIRTIYQLKLGPNKLTLTYYNSGDHKILVQGKHSLLFQIVMSLLGELEDVKFEGVLSTAYRTTIDKGKIDSAMNVAFPVFPQNYPENVKKLIRQAVINLNYYFKSEDYAQYAYPALRALEGHIKYLITISGGSVGKSFNMFNKNSNGEYVYVGQLSNNSKKQQIEDCYRYYKAHRDTLFHFGELLGSTDTTRILSSKEEADEIINNCLNLMCEL